MSDQLPRGLRNFNPGNLERNGTAWQGMAADQSSDPRFIVFSDAKYGIRALAKTLLTYQAKYGCHTIRAIINRWAPPNENDTGVYVNAVAKGCGVAPDQTIDVDTVAVMKPLVEAIIRHENGQQPYAESEILEALHLAGVSDAPEPVSAPADPQPLAIPEREIAEPVAMKVPAVSVDLNALNDDLKPWILLASGMLAWAMHMPEWVWSGLMMAALTALRISVPKKG